MSDEKDIVVDEAQVKREPTAEEVEDARLLLVHLQQRYLEALSECKQVNRHKMRGFVSRKRR